MGLVITEIEEFVQFSPSECFKDFVQDIVNTRCEGDKNSSKQILALTKKLLGYSFHSSSLLRKELHRNVTYPTKTTLLIMLSTIPFFPQMDQISENLYEGKSLKPQIAQNLPCQVGLQ